MEITVGSTGLGSLNEALDQARTANEDVTITLETGYDLSEQVLIYNEDLRHVTITASTTINVDVDSFSQYVRGIDFDSLPFFYGYRSQLPIIDCLFKIVIDPLNYNCSSCKDRDVNGFHLDQSTIEFTNDSGCTDAPHINLFVNEGSNATANYGNFDRGGNRDALSTTNTDWYGDGVRINNSTFTGKYASADDCGDNGFRFERSAKGNIDNAHAVNVGHHALIATSSSIVSARNCDFKDCLDDAIVAYASSNIDARYSDASNTAINYGVIATRTSVINFEGGIANNCGYSGVMANRGSIIDATDATINFSKVDGARCANGSKLELTSATINNSQRDGIHCTHGSEVAGNNVTVDGSGRDGILAYSAQVYANEAIVTNSAQYNVQATRGGKVAVNNSTLDGAGSDNILCYGSEVFANFSSLLNSGARAIESTMGGTVKAYSVDTTGALDWGFAVYHGGQIYAVDSIGTANRTINTWDENGIILTNASV